MKIGSMAMSSRRTLIVLGAGATRGASFNQSEYHLYPPPLDADFFRLLSRSPARKSLPARALLDYVQSNQSPTLDVSMEAVFVELQGSAEFYEQFNIGRGRIVRQPQSIIESFYKVLPSIMRFALPEQCEYHANLASMLEPGDAVISFNYDCLIDEALKSQAGRRWDPRTGYGFAVVSGAEDWRNWGKGRAAAKPIRLLKLHGSLNWDVSETGDVTLIPSPYERASARGAVVPPLGRKPVSDEPFRQAWRAAREAVRTAERLIVIGYSLPQADYLVRALFRADADNEKLRELVVVDPSPAIADRFVALLTKTPDRVETLPALRAFAGWLGAPAP
jgi:SIR2-like domain